jgi:Tyrosyl-DNA phosphodiesterase
LRGVSALTQYFTDSPVSALGMGDYGDDSTSMGSIDYIFITSYIVNFEFLLDEIPELLSLPRACVIYGAKEGSENAWRQASTSVDGTCSVDFICRNPSDPPKSVTNPLAQRIPFGVHHSKLFLVGFSSGILRVVIHTANLRYSDVNNKAQVYITLAVAGFGSPRRVSPLMPFRISTPSPRALTYRTFLESPHLQIPVFFQMILKIAW